MKGFILDAGAWKLASAGKKFSNSHTEMKSPKSNQPLRNLYWIVHSQTAILSYDHLTPFEEL